MPPTETSVTRDQRIGPGRGLERGFTAAFELVMTPTLFGFIGYWLDGQLGTGRLMTIGLTAFVACYVVWKLCYQYLSDMDALEAKRVEPRDDSIYRTDSP